MELDRFITNDDEYEMSEGFFEAIEELERMIGLLTGVSLAVIMFLGFGALSSLFTVDSEVLEIARSCTLFVAGSQPINTLAFVLDGLYYGVSDFGYTAYSTVVIGVISVVFLLVATYLWGLTGVWVGLFFFITLRVFIGFLM